MVIVPADKSHLASYLTLYAKYFNELNGIFGYNKYKTGTEKARLKFLDTISDKNSPYKFIVLLDDNGSFAGIVHLLFTRNIGEILIILMTDKHQTPESAGHLIEESAKLFRIAGIPRMIVQTFPNGKMYDRLYRQLGAETIKKTLALDIRSPLGYNSGN